MSTRKGILLAGGAGSRLHPMTLAVSKQLLPIYDKPMIYYPLSTLMLAGIRDILVISTPLDLPQFRRLLGSGERLGLRFSYLAQPAPRGIAEAFLIGRDWLAGEPVVLALGDNLIHGEGLSALLKEAAARDAGASVFATRVKDAARYGVISFDEDGTPVTIAEKPRASISDWAVVGLYFYDRWAPERAASLRPSARGELEITDLNRLYLEEGELHVARLSRGAAWLDAGTPDSLLQAASFVQAIETRQGLLVGCPEEIAFRLGYIDAGSLKAEARRFENTELGRALCELADEPR